MRTTPTPLTPTIDTSLCLGVARCGACEAVCPTGAFRRLDAAVGAAPQVGAGCSLCGACEETCPAGAISVPFTIGWDE